MTLREYYIEYIHIYIFQRIYSVYMYFNVLYIQNTGLFCKSKAANYVIT